jgi:integral membrane protein
MLATTLGRLRITGFLEGASFLILLLIAMPLKYFMHMPWAVKVVGMAHGILFILFIVLSVMATIRYQWSLKKMLLLWLSSLIPLGTFYADYKLLRPEEVQPSSAL